jgi:hypothetical protein
MDMPRIGLLRAVQVFIASWLLCLPAAKASGEPPSTRAYIEFSHLIAPAKAGDFVLEGSRYDPARKYSGAGFRYAVDGQQETRIDVYVYPAGRMAQDEALNRGMDAYRADIATAVDAGQYSRLQFGSESGFALEELANPATPADSARKGETSALLRAIAEGGRVDGRKLPMTMHLQPHDWPMHSVGYLFYKQLYYFKVRATAAQERISAEDFRALTDRAARTLVPAIEVVNIGDCAEQTITVNSDAQPQELARALVTQSALHQSYNCHPSVDSAGIEAKSVGADVVVIAYGPDEWKSE